MKDSCYLVPETYPPCFIQLGRYGDLILLFPCFKAIYDRTGHKPVVIVSTSYANVFEGISYAKPVPVHWEWWQGIPQARQLAESQFGGAIVPQWWNDTPRPDLVEQQFRGGTVLQCHGHSWGVDMHKWPDFQTSMWERAGFTAEEMRALPVVFDLRDFGREKLLRKSVGAEGDGKPILLLNFAGHSSPFGPYPEVYRVVNRFADRFRIVDMTKMRAHRIFDLLGLYDVAAGLITIDTATLHLAGAGNVEYIAFTRSDWSHSVPKGKCVLEIGYHGAEHRVEELAPVLERWAGGRGSVERQSVIPTGAGGGGGVLAV